MGLFPQAFIDDLRLQADIVQVIQAHVPLRRTGSGFKGLCPFHGEKTPSFSVNRERGVFHCFGCGIGGDVFKFVELQERVGFQDAVRLLAQRFGIQVPEAEEARRDRAADEERESLLKIHEVAAGWFREQLAGPLGAKTRGLLRDRKIAVETEERLGLGYAPPARAALKAHLSAHGFALPLLLRSGLLVERDRGEVVDRFRNRLMIPICRDTGSIVAFGGRALEAGQQPKYLNSPETAIYSKGRTLYGLHLTKPDVRRLGYAVLVEGYFDFAQVLQAGITPVVASCGTALTPGQVHTLRRLADKIVLSFDPDAAGQNAAVRSCDLLVADGFQVNVAILPAGLDPDSFIQQQGGEAYARRLRASQPYLEYLLDRAAEGQDLASDTSRRQFLSKMLEVAARIPDPAARDQFADRLAHKAQILEEVVRTEIRKAAVAKRTTLTARELPAVQDVKPAEKGLIWALVREPEAALRAIAEADEADLDALETSGILRIARALADWAGATLPETLFERLSTQEVELATSIASIPAAPAPPGECLRALKRLRYERERAAVQREIDRLQQLGAASHNDQIDALWVRKKDLLHRLEALSV